MTEPAKGVLAMIVACVVWGLSPLFYKALAHVPPPEVLAHRTIWSLVIFAGLLAFQRRVTAVPRLLTGGDWPRVLFAAVTVSINWGVFIWSVQVGRVTEASLGYYIFPLVAVGIGALVFRERLKRVQYVAVGLAALGVAVMTVGRGEVPLIALILATTFGLYGMVKKGLDAGPVVSVTAEVTLLAPVAVAWLVFSWVNLTTDPGTLALLVLSGALTAGPLILFSAATRRLPLATVGLLQYLNPTLQFVCAVVIFAEPFGLWHLAAFGLIWTALALYSASSLRGSRPVGQ